MAIVSPPDGEAPTDDASPISPDGATMEGAADDGPSATDDAPAASDDGPLGDGSPGSPGDGGPSTCSPACVNPHGTTACEGAACVPACAAGYGDCDGDPADGCETPTTTTANCGTCGKVCTSDAGAATCNAGACETSCNLSGTWAAKVSVQVTWASSLSLAAGSGSLNFWVMVKGTQSGTSIPITMVPCEITIPDFSSSPAGGNELYGVTFPNTLFDHAPPYLPSTSGTVTLGGSSPGSTYSLPVVAFLIGDSLTNPTTDAWPAVAMVTQVDMDQDGKFGVTTPYKTGGTYQFVPLDLGKSARSDKAYLAARLAASFSGTLSSCTGIAGSATVTHLDTHIIGCEISGGGGDCMTTQSNFADSNRPAYMIGAASLSLVKVADAATCADVRSAL